MSVNPMSRDGMQGISSLVYRKNEDTGKYERVMASLIFLRKDNDAKLDLEVNEAPAWIAPDAEVSMNIVWPSKGLVVFSGKVTYILGKRVHIGDLTFKETIQRRHDVKVAFDARGTLYAGGRTQAFPVEFDNISASGAGFRLFVPADKEDMVEKGRTYTLEFSPEEGKTITLDLELLRANQKDGIGPFHCGAIFRNIRPGIETALRQLVFTQQREENQRERELRREGIIEVDVFMKA